MAAGELMRPPTKWVYVGCRAEAWTSHGTVNEQLRSKEVGVE